MEYEKYFLTRPDQTAKVEAVNGKTIYAVAYPITEDGKVYYLHRQPIIEVQAGHGQLIMLEPNGTDRIKYPGSKPVLIWCQNKKGIVWGSKIYSVVPSSNQQNSQVDLQPSS